jgi:MOSC domain-containing protein YiiM
MSHVSENAEGSVESIHFAPARREPRTQAQSVRVLPDWGIEGDAYGGPGERQVLLFWAESRSVVDTEVEPGLCYPKFRENLTIKGLDPGTLKPGERLKVGTSMLRVTSVNKRCYPECGLPRNQCAIRAHLAFCEVVQEGEIAQGDSVSLFRPTGQEYTSPGG